MELSNYLVSWVVTYLGDLQPTYTGVIIYSLSSMDIPVAEDYAMAAMVLLYGPNSPKHLCENGRPAPIQAKALSEPDRKSRNN